MGLGYCELCLSGSFIKYLFSRFNLSFLFPIADFFLYGGFGLTVLMIYFLPILYEYLKNHALLGECSTFRVNLF